MKRVIFCTVLASFVFMAAAQSSERKSSERAFNKGDKFLNLGVGVGTPYWGGGYSSSLPVNPTLTYEGSVDDEISAGVTLAYGSSKYSYFGDWKYNGYYIGGRGSYHFDISKPNVDLYAGAGLGYVIVSVSSKVYGYGATATSGVGYTAFGGGRYYLGKAAVYAELGYGSFSVLNAGISFKL